MNERLCNQLPGHTRCLGTISRGVCPGQEKFVCCSAQKKNATPAELLAATTALDEWLKTDRVRRGSPSQDRVSQSLQG